MKFPNWKKKKKTYSKVLLLCFYQWIWRNELLFITEAWSWISCCSVLTVVLCCAVRKREFSRLLIYIGPLTRQNTHPTHTSWCTHKHHSAAAKRKKQTELTARLLILMWKNTTKPAGPRPAAKQRLTMQDTSRHQVEEGGVSLLVCVSIP